MEPLELRSDQIQDYELGRLLGLSRAEVVRRIEAGELGEPDRRPSTERSTYRFSVAKVSAILGRSDWYVHIPRFDEHIPEFPYSVVYFMHMVHLDLIKVGFSRYLRQRWAKLEYEYRSTAVLLGTCPGGRMAEHVIHGDLRNHRHSGELYYPTEAVLAYIDWMKR